MTRDIQPYMDSLTRTLSIGDSIFIRTYFRTAEDLPAEYWGRMINNDFFYYDTKYEVETSAMVNFSRDSDNRLKNYPNPAMQEFTLNVDLAESREGRYMILNNQGVTVQEETFRDVSGIHTINISDLASGNYVLYVMVEGDALISKFVKIDGSN